jgi:CheY-like chemotaxis protein
MIKMKRILIIDDDEQLLELLASYVESAGYQVGTATDGARAAQLFRAAPFDLVVTDMIMPNREGLETIIGLRGDFPNIPIIAMSGGIDRSKLYLDLAKKLGANRTLLKPFVPAALTEAIAALLAAAEKPTAGLPP